MSVKKVITQLVGMLLLTSLAACVCQQRGPVAVDPWYPQITEKGDRVAGVFEGRIPCTEPSLVNCEKVKVALALYRDARSNALTSYQLARVYVATNPEGSQLIVTGAAGTARGTKLDPNATVIWLDEKAPREFRAYWAIDENVLFMLNQDLSPKVGTASWSYVLNRTR